MKKIFIQKIHTIYSTDKNNDIINATVIIDKDNITIKKENILDIYHLSFDFLGSRNNTINILISYGTKEYDELEKILLSKMSIDNKLMHIEEFANKASLKHIPSDKLLEIIEEINDENFTEGYKKAQANIRDALGIKY